MMNFSEMKIVPNPNKICWYCSKRFGDHAPGEIEDCSQKYDEREIFTKLSNDLESKRAITKEMLGETFEVSEPAKEPPFMDEIRGFLDSDYRAGFWWGQFGRGKTFLARCVLNQAMKRNIRVCEATGVDLVEGFRGYKPHPLMNALKYSPVLLIDDFLQATWKKRDIETIWNILNTRMQRGGKTIITCNYDREFFQAHMTAGSNEATSGSLIQRLVPTLFLHFEGKSFRS